MSIPTNPLILIPARMASTRLPGKPLADIHGEPMIVHVWRRAMEANLGPVVVAASEQEIADAVRQAGGTAVMTRPNHESGSDRIFEALETIDPDGKYDALINVQGDLPTLSSDLIKIAVQPFQDANVDITTLVCEITEDAEKSNPNIVKAVVALPANEKIGRALYFSREVVPGGDGPLYHHIGLYAYRRQALARFVNLTPGVLERRERLEQLRALENGMRIDAALVDTVPLGVDTPADLERARTLLAKLD
jgi:3-deoxy-manno-octulosonate cytidylyltransferase (CMP-KDO synthetase)